MCGTILVMTKGKKLKGWLAVGCWGLPWRQWLAQAQAWSGHPKQCSSKTSCSSFAVCGWSKRETNLEAVGLTFPSSQTGAGSLSIQQ